MAIAVVDALEVVDIDHHHIQQTAVAPGILLVEGETATIPTPV
jgi:hypothetical protein